MTVAIHPNAADSIVMKTRADMAPAKTIILGCFMAMIAAMKKVLSPNSETTTTERDARNPCRKLPWIAALWKERNGDRLKKCMDKTITIKDGRF